MITRRGRRAGLELMTQRRSGLDGLPVTTFTDLVRPDPVRIKPPRGESFLELMERMRELLEDLAGRHPTAVVLAVSHENPILAASAIAGRAVEAAARDRLANCEWVRLEWRGED